MMMFLFGHAVEIRRCSFQRHADDSHLPKADSCWSGDSTKSHSSGVPCLDPPRYYAAFDTAGESVYASEPKRLRSRPVTVVARGRGWTSSTPGHLHTSPSFCRAHGDVSHGGPGKFPTLRRVPRRGSVTHHGAQSSPHPCHHTRILQNKKSGGMASAVNREMSDQNEQRSYL